MSEKEFVPGLYVKPPHEKAPDFVKFSISIKRADLGNFLRSKSDEWINIQVKESQGGKWYCEVDNWKPNENPQQQQPQQPANSAPDFDDPVPF